MASLKLKHFCSQKFMLCENYNRSTCDVDPSYACVCLHLAKVQVEPSHTCVMKKDDQLALLHLAYHFTCMYHAFKFSSCQIFICLFNVFRLDTLINLIKMKIDKNDACENY